MYILSIVLQGCLKMISQPNGGRGQGFCNCSAKILVVARVMIAEGVKTCMLSFIDDPLALKIRKIKIKAINLQKIWEIDFIVELYFIR
jgi:hypothetical protein